MNDFTTDAAPPPSSEPPPSSGSDPRGAVINENRAIALGQLAKSESIEGYAAEREDQAAAIDRDEELPENRKSAWYRRASKALADAANEAQGIRTNGQEQPQFMPQDARPDEYYAPADPVEHARKTGAAMERVKAYFGENQEAKQFIVDWGQAMDPESTVADWLIQNESAVAPQILERLAAHPEGWSQLAQLPPQTRDRWLSKLEGHIEAEISFASQQRQQQQQWSQEAARRSTHAPPPIRAPRGGANPPRNIGELASKDDASDYVRFRRQQENRSRD
jgi:hypothetical protein